jgi:hypothetical protein
MIAPRWAHHLYASVFGYFWLPCQLCGRMRGGQEWKKGYAVHDIANPSEGRGICDEHGNDFTRLADGTLVWGMPRDLMSASLEALMPKVAELSHAHKGDVVLLRFNRPAVPEFFEIARENVKPISERTGVEFVFLDDAVEVVSASGDLDDVSHVSKGGAT